MGITVLSTLANGLRVIECLMGKELTVREIAEACELPRQTAYRLVATLVAEGWVDRKGENYQPSIRIWSLAARSFRLDGLRDALSSSVRELAAEYGETVHLAVYDRGYAVYVDKADGSNPIRSYTVLGGRSPAYCVATGKLLLSHIDNEERERVITSKLERYTPLTITSQSGLREELERVRRQGYSINRGEWRDGVGGIAVPIWSPTRQVVAALGFSGPTGRLLGKQAVLLEALQQVAHAKASTNHAVA